MDVLRCRSKQRRRLADLCLTGSRVFRWDTAGWIEHQLACPRDAVRCAETRLYVLVARIEIVSLRVVVPQVHGGRIRGPEPDMQIRRIRGRLLHLERRGK